MQRDEQDRGHHVGRGTSVAGVRRRRGRGRRGLRLVSEESLDEFAHVRRIDPKRVTVRRRVLDVPLGRHGGEVNGAAGEPVHLLGESGDVPALVEQH